MLKWKIIIHNYVKSNLQTWFKRFSDKSKKVKTTLYLNWKQYKISYMTYMNIFKIKNKLRIYIQVRLLYVLRLDEANGLDMGNG